VPVNTLAGLALKPVLDGRLRFTPSRYASTYQAWLENLRDWPISRQLWWGHRIPIWYIVRLLNDRIPKGLFSLIEKLKDNPKVAIRAKNLNTEDEIPASEIDENTHEEFPYSIYICLLKDDPTIIEEIEEKDFKHDHDVLDTWFSSALWPFSTMGWPDDTPEMKTFYPGDVLCTAREIITLWVSRMLMMGQYCAGDIPFRDVYIHAMIQDGQGRKMSKSLGNGIDPLVAIDSHGADAMRFTLASMTTDTQDLKMPVEKMKLPDGRTVNTSPKFDIGRNFCNKLWNASRFAMMNLEGVDANKFDAGRMDITDKWILARLTKTIHEVTRDLDNFKYNEPLNTIYRFFWNDFCDWYLEWAKPRLKDDEQRPIAQNVLAFVLDNTLRLLHPFVPFITEGIFQKLNEIAPSRKLKGLAEAKEANALIEAAWPDGLEFDGYGDVEKQISTVQNVIRPIRDTRSKYNIAPSKRLTVSVDSPPSIVETLNENSYLISNLAVLDDFTSASNIDKPVNSAVSVVDDMQIYVHDVIDRQAEQARLEKQKQQIEKVIIPIQAKLNNEDFVNKAKPEVVRQARAKLKELTAQAEAVDRHLSELKS